MDTGLLGFYHFPILLLGFLFTVILNCFGAFITSPLTFAEKFVLQKEVFKLMKVSLLSKYFFIIIIYEQNSQMALSCFHYDSSLCKCFPVQKPP